MTVTLDLPPQVEQAYLAAAEARGVSVDELVQEAVIAGRPGESAGQKSVFEEGLGLFGSPEDAALLDEIVALVYAERRRPSKRPTAP